MPSPVFYSSLQNNQRYGLAGTLTTNSVVKASECNLQGIIINSHSSGTFRLYNATAIGSGTPIGGTLTLAAGERWIPFFGERFSDGLTVIVSGTIDATVIYN